MGVNLNKFMIFIYIFFKDTFNCPPKTANIIDIDTLQDIVVKTLPFKLKSDATIMKDLEIQAGRKFR